ncbi:Histone-fold [Babesia duncani]|uniref:Histone-fold n=1 Tax=Babesia duncani TaxID=323732 RepID=A0AAD9PI42_9APIC|nr:Histone-fold [Babesia duncani]
MDESQERIDFNLISDEELELSTPAVENEYADTTDFRIPQSVESSAGSRLGVYSGARTPRSSRMKSLDNRTRSPRSSRSTSNRSRAATSARASVASVRLSNPQDPSLQQDNEHVDNEETVSAGEYDENDRPATSSRLSGTGSVDVNDESLDPDEENRDPHGEYDNQERGRKASMEKMTSSRAANDSINFTRLGNKIKAAKLLSKKMHRRLPQVMSPSRVIEEYRKGNLTNQQAIDAVIRYRVNSMLHKPSDHMHVDKEGNVRPTKSMDFGKARDESGRIIRKGGLTRIEREILAYQKSTHLLIPRSIFARVVRERMKLQKF